MQSQSLLNVKVALFFCVNTSNLDLQITNVACVFEETCTSLGPHVGVRELWVKVIPLDLPFTLETTKH